MWGDRVLVAVLLAHIGLPAVAESGSCAPQGSGPEKVQALVQKAHRTTVARRRQNQLSAQHNESERFFVARDDVLNGVSTRVIAPAVVGVETNPSGASAPLNEVGYTAVADRCCSAEMTAFVSRTIVSMDHEVCDEGGLTGLVKFHSCANRQSFDKLGADILKDWGERCTYLAQTGHCATYFLPTDCPTYPDVPDEPACGCTKSQAATVDLTVGTSSNNIGGEGPNTGPEELRFDNAGKAADGTAFDVVITAVDSYSTPTASLNGATGAMGRINLNHDTETQFKFSFVQPGSHIPVTVPEIHMAVFDLDGDDASGVEYASSTGYTGYVTDESPGVSAALFNDGKTQFETSASTANIADPTDPNSLTSAQRGNSVMFFYENVNQFYITFGIRMASVNAQSRNFLFAFESSLNDRCAA